MCGAGVREDPPGGAIGASCPLGLLFVLLADVERVPHAGGVTDDERHPGEHGHPAEASSPEDLAALVTRLLEEVGEKQKHLAEAANVSYPTLNAWMNRTRGTSRIDPDVLRAITSALRGFGAKVTVREVFEAAGRAVPGPTDKEREERLLRVWRRLPKESQRALIQTAEALERSARAS